jgi:hypothetical protein
MALEEQQRTKAIDQESQLRGLNIESAQQAIDANKAAIASSANAQMEVALNRPRLQSIVDESDLPESKKRAVRVAINTGAYDSDATKLIEAVFPEEQERYKAVGGAIFDSSNGSFVTPPPGTSTPEEFGRMIAEERDKAGKLIQTAGIKLVHIPYRGSGPSVAAAVGGEVQTLFSGPGAAIPQIKAGKLISAGVIVEGPAKFKAAGIKSLVAASGDESFHFRCAVKVGTSKVMRTRPIFNEWSATFTLCMDSEVVDLPTVRQSLEAAGRLVGVGDWRPGAPKGGSYGRFVIG